MSASPSIRRNPRAKQALGALFGMQTPTFQIIAPWLSWHARARRWLLRKTFTLAWQAMRRILWTWRRILAPWHVATAVWVFAALASTSPRGWATVLTVAAVGAAPMWWWLGGWMWRFTRRRRLKPPEQRCWYGGFYLALSGWAAVAAGWTPGPPWLGVLWLATFTAWVRWLWHHRTRPVVHAGCDIAEADPQGRAWATVKAMTGTTLINPVELADPGRLEADIDLTGTDLLVSHVRAAVPHIAKAFGRPAGSVIADYKPGRLEHEARLTVVYDNPCDEPVVYDESWVPTERDIADGCVPFHLYPNGVRGRVRLWLAGAGTVNSLFSGDIRTGKSAGMEAKMIQAVMTGRVWPMAGDPQRGVSVPTWCGPGGRAAWQAVDEDGIWAQLCGLREAMYARSAALAQLVWVDQWGDEQVGLSCWDPELTGWPAVGFLLDEAHMLMKIPDFAALIKEILKMANKTGIYLDLATQYPAIEEFGNDMAVRQPLTAGNGLAYRNTAGSVKEMIIPKHLPSPYDIPTETITGEHTKGTLIAVSQAPRSSLPVYSRSVWAQRARHWADIAMTRCPELDPATAAAFARWMPGTEAAPVPPRERAVVADAAPATTVGRILDYLNTRPGGRATTGVIAAALDITNLSTLSNALARARKAGKVHQVRRGEWAAGPDPATAAEAEDVA